MLFTNTIVYFYFCFLGETSSSISPVQTIQAKYIITHPGYNKPTNLNNDIALVKLSRPALLNKYVRTVCLPRQGDDVVTGRKCYLSGLYTYIF